MHKKVNFVTGLGKRANSRKEYVLETSIDETYLDVNDTIEKNVDIYLKTNFSNAHSF